jgi:ubiquitin C-terminal hydrolase
MTNTTSNSIDAGKMFLLTGPILQEKGTLNSASIIKEKNWLGHAVCWIKETILNPMYQFFVNFFLCGNDDGQEKNPPPLLLKSQLSTTQERLNGPPTSQKAKSRSPTFSMKILPPPLKLSMAMDDVVSRPLVNLGATCYMNSVLQMIARLNAFNGMLTHPIQFVASRQFDGEEDEAYAVRIQKAENNFLETLEDREALQGHLCAIIEMMRAPALNVPIDYRELQTLFYLLQKCGWEYSPYQQLDPQELIAFLKEKLGSDMDSIDQLGRIRYVKDGEECISDSKGDPLPEIAIALPVDKKGKLLPEFDTMDKLIANFLCENIDDYCPVKGGPIYQAKKEVYFIGKPPETLFVQQKRFSYNRSTSAFNRIDCETPFSETIKVPFFSDPSLPPVEHTYQLKVVIGHGGGRTIDSGHYTAMALHQFQSNNGQMKGQWMLYNDRARPRPYSSNLQEKGSVVQDITRKAYYLAYERID